MILGINNTLLYICYVKLLLTGVQLNKQSENKHCTEMTTSVVLVNATFTHSDLSCRFLAKKVLPFLRHT